MTGKEHLPQAKATTTGMKAQGFYNKHSTTQWSSISYLQQWMEEAVTSLPQLNVNDPLHFVDFGCSEGANSLKVMALLVEAANRRFANSIQTIHSDLPSNDYSTLLRTIGNREQPPYTTPSVFGGITGGSMFNQLLPPQSIHLAVSFNSIGFFSERPLDRIADYILPNEPSSLSRRGSISPQEKESCEEQAWHDLEIFLKARANELVPGGKLLLHSFGRNSHVSTSDLMLDSLNDALTDHIETGELSQDIYERYYHPAYVRNLDQLLEPILPDTGSLSHLFTLKKAECYETPVPFVEQFKQDKDPVAFAKQMVSFYRAFTEAGLQEALKETDGASALLESIYARAEERIRQTPDHYDFHFISVAILLTRTAAPE